MLRFVFIALWLPLLGCGSNKAAPSTQPTSVRERQEQAMKDPMNYKVEPGTPRSTDRGGMWQFDRDGFKRDVDHVFNP